MKVLLDTNVILDYLLLRQPWGEHASVIWDAAKTGALRCCVTASSITDIFYVSRKLVGAAPARLAVRGCLDVLEVLPVDVALLEAAYAFETGDLEDALQVAAATAHGVDALVTRDGKLLITAPLPVLTPEALAIHVTSSRGGSTP